MVAQPSRNELGGKIDGPTVRRPARVEVDTSRFPDVGAGLAVGAALAHKNGLVPEMAFRSWVRGEAYPAVLMQPGVGRAQAGVDKPADGFFGEVGGLVNPDEVVLVALQAVDFFVVAAVLEIELSPGGEAPHLFLVVISSKTRKQRLRALD